MKTLYDQTPEILELVLRKKIKDNIGNSFKHLEKTNAIWEDGGKTFEKVTNLVHDYLARINHEGLRKSEGKVISSGYFNFLKELVKNERFENAEQVANGTSRERMFDIVLASMKEKTIFQKIQECEEIQPLLKKEHVDKLERLKNVELEGKKKDKKEENSLLEKFKEQTQNKIACFEEDRGVYLKLIANGYEEETKPEGQQKGYLLLENIEDTEPRFVNKDVLMKTKIIPDYEFFPFESKTEGHLRSEMLTILEKHFETKATAQMAYNFIVDNFVGAIGIHYETTFKKAIESFKKQHKTKTLDMVGKIAKGDYDKEVIVIHGNEYNRDEFINTYIKLKYTAKNNGKGIDVTELYNNECNRHVRTHTIVTNILYLKDSGLDAKDVDYITAKSTYIENFPIQDEGMLKVLMQKNKDQLSIIRILTARYKFGEIKKEEARLLVQKINQRANNVYKDIFLSTKITYKLHTDLIESLLKQIEIQEEIFSEMEFAHLKDFLLRITNNATKALEILNKIKRKELVNIHFIFTEKKLPEEPKFDEREYNTLKSCIWTS